MSNTQDQTDSSLLWDCFTNWSLTLEKITKQKPQRKKPVNKSNRKINITVDPAPIHQN
jgi:hypothetical protein